VCSPTFAVCVSTPFIPICGQDCGQTGTILAGLLNAPQATFASNIERGEDGTFTVERETDTGEWDIYILG
jgi:electron transfer flavoprotein alpha/beta subunit